MSRFGSSVMAVFCLLMLCAGWDVTLHAYIDPGSGSLILQVLLGGLTGVAVVIRVYWRSVKAHLSRVTRRKPPHATGE